MPHYDYFCLECGHSEEVLQKMSDPKITICPLCQKQSFERKLGAGIGLQFHGEGFYATDYPSHPVVKESSVSAPAQKCNQGCGCKK